MDFGRPLPAYLERVLPTLPFPITPPALARVRTIPFIVEERGDHRMAREKSVELTGCGLIDSLGSRPYLRFRVKHREVEGPSDAMAKIARNSTSRIQGIPTVQAICFLQAFNLYTDQVFGNLKDAAGRRSMSKNRPHRTANLHNSVFGQIHNSAKLHQETTTRLPEDSVLGSEVKCIFLM